MVRASIPPPSVGAGRGWATRAGRGCLLVAAILLGCRPTQPVHPRPTPSPRFMPEQEPGGGWRVRNVFPRLRLQNPTFAVQPPRDPGLWFIGEREGRLLAVRGQGDASAATTVVDLRAHTLGWQDCGLLNMALHPEFGERGSPNRGYIYLWYNHTEEPHPGPGYPMQGRRSANRLSRFTIPDGGLVADPASELVLIEQQRTNIDHQGGGMFFHPADGFLYLAVGDGGHDYRESRDTFFVEGVDEAQRIDRELLSGVLRIDVDRRGGSVSHPIVRQPRHGRTGGYFIPNDNPWLDPRGERLEEFFAVGLRNPHRMTLDPGSGRIFAGDVGETLAEEIDLIERGGNYQWGYLEGAVAYGSRPARLLGVERAPFHVYRNRGYSAVIGGVVYRGSQHPELQGQYLFGDNGSGEIWTLDAAAPTPGRPAPLLRLPQEQTTYAGLSSFAVDAAGEVHLCVLGRNEERTGALLRLERAPARTPAPATLSGTGLFTDTRGLTAHGSLFPYDVNASFWSDHASKTRWLYVPPDRKIHFAAQGPWTFPAGTIAVKHFDLAFDERDPGKVRRLETRVLVRDESGGAYGRTYKWRPDGRDADLLTGPITERLTRVSREPIGPLLALPEGGSGEGALLAREGGWTLTSPRGGSLFARIDTAAVFDVAAAWGPLEGGRSGLLLRGERGATLSLTWAAGDPRHLRIEARDAGGSTRVTTSATPGPWLRLRRAEGRLQAYAGEDGVSWQELDLPSGDFAGGSVGLHVASQGDGIARAEIAAAVRCEVRDHYYPAAAECATCHNAGSGYLLGVNTRQWNRAAAASPENQLVRASRQGLLDTSISPTDPERWHRLVPIDDRRASVESRVRSYLDANCSQCHRPGQIVQVGIDARYETPLAEQGLILGGVRWPRVPRAEDHIVTPKAPDRSRLYRRVRDHVMPPLGSLLPDTAAVDLVRGWILGLEGTPALGAVTIRRREDGQVELSHGDPDAQLHYTTDGSAPGTDTARYRGPFRLPGATTLRAAAFRAGFLRSVIASARIDPASP